MISDILLGTGITVYSVLIGTAITLAIVFGYAGILEFRERRRRSKMSDTEDSASERLRQLYSGWDQEQPSATRSRLERENADLRSQISELIQERDKAWAAYKDLWTATYANHVTTPGAERQ